MLIHAGRSFGSDIEPLAVGGHHLYDFLLVGGRIGPEPADGDLIICQVPKGPAQGVFLGVFGLAISISAFDVDRHIVNGGHPRLISIAGFIGAGRIPLLGGNDLVVVVQGIGGIGFEWAGSTQGFTQQLI